MKYTMKELTIMEKKVLATVGEKEITNIDIENALKSLDPYQAMQFKTEEGKNTY